MLAFICYFVSADLMNSHTKKIDTIYSGKTSIATTVVCTVGLQSNHHRFFLKPDAD